MRALTVALSVLLFAPAPAAQPEGDQAPPTAAPFSLGEFQTLRWLEGAWRGSAPGGAPFCEGLRFSDDSTLVMT